MLFASFSSYAAVIVGPNTIINVPTTYSNTTIDLTNGSFIIKNNATLTIENCSIIGELSPTNHTLFDVQLGTLKLTNNNVSISAPLIAEHPDTQSLQYVIRLEAAKADLTGNSFIIDKEFAAGLLITSASQPTDNINIVANHIENFHGAFYLLNSQNSVIDDNIFTANSYGNIVLIGDNSKIINNAIYFAGRDRIGNAMDIINSKGVLVHRNVVFTPTCHGVYVFSSEDVEITDNSITGGITYAMSLLSHIATIDQDKDGYIFKIIDAKNLLPITTKNIRINNNVMSQNRYGIAARDTDNLVVNKNYFSQRFKDAVARKFWTDNSILMINVTNVTWTNNIYKEAFTQENGGDNSMTQFVPFPATGGVVL